MAIKYKFVWAVAFAIIMEAIVASIVHADPSGLYNSTFYLMNVGQWNSDNCTLSTYDAAGFLRSSIVDFFLPLQVRSYQLPLGGLDLPGFRYGIDVDCDGSSQSGGVVVFNKEGYKYGAYTPSYNFVNSPILEQHAPALYYNYQDLYSVLVVSNPNDYYITPDIYIKDESGRVKKKLLNVYIPKHSWYEVSMANISGLSSGVYYARVDGVDSPDKFSLAVHHYGVNGKEGERYAYPHAPSGYRLYVPELRKNHEGFHTEIVILSESGRAQACIDLHQVGQPVYSYCHVIRGAQTWIVNSETDFPGLPDGRWSAVIWQENESQHNDISATVRVHNDTTHRGFDYVAFSDVDWVSQPTWTRRVFPLLYKNYGADDWSSRIVCQQRDDSTDQIQLQLINGGPALDSPPLSYGQSFEFDLDNQSTVPNEFSGGGWAQSFGTNKQIECVVINDNNISTIPATDFMYAYEPTVSQTNSIIGGEQVNQVQWMDYP